MYVRFSTLAELSSHVLSIPREDIPRALGTSPSAWYTYRSGMRNPSRRDASLLRSNVATLVTKATRCFPGAKLRVDEFVANIFEVQDFFCRLDALFPQVLPRIAARLAGQVLAAKEKTDPSPKTALAALFEGDTKKPHHVAGYLLSRCGSVVREEFERRASGELSPVRRVSLPLDPSDPVKSFLKIREETFEKDVLLLPSPWYIDVVMCCAERLSFIIDFAKDNGEAGEKVTVRGSGKPRRGEEGEVPGFVLTVY